MVAKQSSLSAHSASALRPGAILENRSAPVRIRIIDVSKENYNANLYTSTTKAQLAIQMDPPAETRARVISIGSVRTISRLDINQSLLDTILLKYEMDETFEKIVSSFGQLPSITEGHNYHFAYDNTKPSQSTLYQVRFVEENRRGGHNPWSFRRTGVYHYGGVDELDVFVLLHCTRDSKIEQRLAVLKDDTALREQFCSNPSILHHWILAQQDKWPPYLSFLDSRAADSDLALVGSPEDTEATSSFRQLQNLRHTKDLILLAQTCCEGNAELLGHFVNPATDYSPSTTEFRNLRTSLLSYIQAANALKERVQNLTELITITLTESHRIEAAKLRNEVRDLTQQTRNGQLQLAESNSQIRDLTKEMQIMAERTVNDATTVKTITFVSAIYLPGSFVATLFGMNFFAFDEENGRLRISPDFWIFAVIWVPLTVLTGAVYVYIQQGASRQTCTANKRHD